MTHCVSFFINTIIIFVKITFCYGLCNENVHNFKNIALSWTNLDVFFFKSKLKWTYIQINRIDTFRNGDVYRSRLEAFEQTCSVDQMSSRCAGPPSACRESILGILGTMLRTNCECKDTSPSKFYDCMGWQRVFWFNSCVGKYFYVNYYYNNDRTRNSKSLR